MIAERFDALCSNAIRLLVKTHTYGIPGPLAAIDVVFGLGNGFPPCCVARFALQSLVDPRGRQAVQRGVLRAGGHTWVPCGFVHPCRV